MGIKQIKKYKLTCDNCKCFKVKEFTENPKYGFLSELTLKEFYDLFKLQEFESSNSFYVDKLHGSEGMLHAITPLVVCKECYNLLLKRN
jgi:hypothetical protein